MVDVSCKLLAIIFTLGFFVEAYFIRLFVGSCYHPAAIFSLAWGFYFLVPLILVFPAPINPFAVLYILSCVVGFAVPVFFTNPRRQFFMYKNSCRKNLYLKNINSKFINISVVLSSVLAVGFGFGTILINGWTLSDIFFDLQATSGSFAAHRGKGGINYGIIGSLGVVFTYLSASLGGLVYSYKVSAWEKWGIAFFAIISGLLAMIIQSSKLIFLLAACFFVSGIFLSNLCGAGTIKFNKKNLFKIIRTLVLLFPFLLFSFMSREHYGDLDGIYKKLDMLRYDVTSYALGEIYAFSDFFSFYVGMDSVSNYPKNYYNVGAYTFTSIVEMFGEKVCFPPGIYLETGWYNNLFETNVFTAFRGIVLDFGIVGSILLFCILGVFSHLVFLGVLNSKFGVLNIAAYVHIVVFLLMTYLMSVFMARYMYANFFLMTMILFLNYFGGNINTQRSKAS